MNAIFKYTIIIFSFALISCRQDFTPKPRGFMKVEYPVKIYARFESEAPFSFEYPDYIKILPDTSMYAEKYWYNMDIIPLNGTIYLSYKEVTTNLDKYIQDTRILAYKHSIKAESIEESRISRPQDSVYGLLYDLSGNTASSLQFYVTDSTKHFLRGSLYFNTTPQKDSLAPILSFIREDVLHMIETFRWER